MRIFIIGTAFPLRGGIAHFNALLADHLGKKHDVQTVTFKRQYPKFLFPGKSQEEGKGSESARPAPQLIDSINPFNWIKVAKHVASFKPDLLIFKYWLPFFGPCFGTIAKFVKKYAGTKVMFICDNVIPHERRPGDVMFTKYAFRYADYFIVQSESVEKDLLRYFPGSKHKRISHPVYENFGKPISKEEARRQLGLGQGKIIIYFGYVRPYKGLMILIEAMKNIPGVKLLVVGEFYDDEKKYRQKVADMNLGKSIEFFADYVPNDRVGLYFCAADVVVLPYISATQSGIIQIAYNFNKPVIATDVGGLGEVILDNITGFIVPPGNPAELANAVNRYYNEQRELEFSGNVQIEKKKYSWDNFVEAIESLIEEGRLKG